MDNTEPVGVVLAIGLLIRPDGSRNAALLIGPNSATRGFSDFAIGGADATEALAAFERVQRAWDKPAPEKAA